VPFLVFESRDLVVASPGRLGKSIVILLRRDKRTLFSGRAIPVQAKGRLEQFSDA